MILNLLIGAVALVPLVVAIRGYLLTRIPDFISFSFIYFLGGLVAFLNSFEPFGTWYWILREIAIVCFTFAVFTYAARLMDLKNRTYRKVILAFGGTYGILLILMTFLWRAIPDQSSLNFLWNAKPYPLAPNRNAGIVIAGTIIHSASHIVLRTVFSTFVFTFFLFATWTTDPFHPTERIAKAAFLWKMTAFMLFLFNLFLYLVWYLFPVSPAFGFIFAFLAIFLTMIIAIRYPEGFLLSKAQIYRVASMYPKLNRISSKEAKWGDFIDYIHEVSQIVSTKADNGVLPP